MSASLGCQGWHRVDLEDDLGGGLDFDAAKVDCIGMEEAEIPLAWARSQGVNAVLPSKGLSNVPGLSFLSLACTGASSILRDARFSCFHSDHANATERHRCAQDHAT